MQVSIDTVAGLERRMNVSVPAEEVENEVSQRLKKAAETIRLDGFRKGKVPFNVVRQRYGKGVRQEVVGELVSRSFQDAVTQEKVRPAGQPSIDSLTDEAGKDLEFVALFEVYPEIVLQDFSAVTVVKPVAEIADADIDKMIGVLREQNAQWVAVDRKAQTTDQAKIDYAGRKEGEPFDGGSAEGSMLVLGSGQMIPGFEDALVDMEAGQSKTVALTFPEDYHSEDLKGADVEFDITVHEVQEKQLPELDEALFEKFGVKEGGLDKFRDEVRGNMERELRNAVKNKVKTRLMTELLEKHTVELPKALLQGEIQALRKQMLSQFGGGMDFDESLLPDDLFSGEAEKRVALGLIVAKVIEVAEIKADADKVKQQIEELAATYEQPEDVIRYYYSNQELLTNIQSSVLEEQVVEHILETAALSEESCTYEEAVEPDQPKEEPEAETEESED